MRIFSVYLFNYSRLVVFQDFGRLLMDSLSAAGVSSDDMESWKGALAVIVNGIAPKNEITTRK